MTGLELDAMLAHDHREEDLRLHHGEVISDARARSSAERQIRVARALLRALRKEAIGVETLGILPVIGMAMEHVRAEADDRAGLDVVVAEPIGGDRLALEDPRGRIEAQRFVEDTTRELEGLDVLEDRVAIAEHRRGLVSHAALDVGVLREEMERP